MPWFLVDDTLSSHPKAREAGLPAMGLWVVCGAYASQYLTEGVVPDWFVATWPNGRKLAEQLVLAGLWLVVDDGWQFHQWDERQRTKEQVEADRARTRERQRRWREQRRVAADAEVSAAVTNAVTDTVSHTVSGAVSNGVTNPVSNGAQALPGHSSSSLGPRKRGTRLPPDWKPADSDTTWQRNEGIDDLLARRELAKFIDYWTAKAGQQAVKLDWSATWRNWLRTAVERTPSTPTKPHGRAMTEW